jgi:rod shape-determining protein MreD
MRWFAFLLLVMALLTAQSAVAPRLAVFGARPDWLLVTVVFLGLFATPRQAITGGWVLGLAADLMTLERLGFLAVSYAATAVLVTGVRELLFRNRWTTQLGVTLVASVLLQTAWMIYHRSLYGSADSALGEFAGRVVFGSLYTAAWSPLMVPALRRIGRPLGIALPRYSYAGLHRLGAAHV